MAKHMTKEDWAAIRLKHSKMTKEEARVFLRSVMGPPHKELVGEEYNHVKLMLALLEPYGKSNNQHTWTDSYKVGNIRYDITYWPNNFEPTIVEYLPEEN